MSAKITTPISFLDTQLRLHWKYPHMHPFRPTFLLALQHQEYTILCASAMLKFLELQTALVACEGTYAMVSYMVLTT